MTDTSTNDQSPLTGGAAAGAGPAWILSGFADEAGGTIQEQIRTLRKAGMSWVDLRNVEGHNIASLPEQEAHKVHTRLQDAGIRVGMLGSPIGKIDISDDFGPDLDRLRHLGRLKPILDCSRVRIFSYYNTKGRSLDQWRTEALDRLGQLKDLAGQLGLVLFHENERHIFGEGCEQVLQIVAHLRDSEPDGTFKAIFDFDNYNQAGENVWETWLKLRDQTDAFHLKDSDSKNQHVPLGQGAGFAREILADAATRGWTGILSLEPHLARSPAVLATGPSGQANQALKEMTAQEVWQVAARAARDVLEKINAPLE